MDMDATASRDKSLEICMYKEWMRLQEQELSHLLQQSLNIVQNNNHETCTSRISEFIDEIIKNFENYAGRRSSLVRGMKDASSFFSPSWCTPFEASLFWIAGCRPSSFFNLVFALCGSEIDSKLAEPSQGGCRFSKFPLLSASQLCSIDNLQRRTIGEEDKLSSQAATLQQEMTDMPLAIMARKSNPDCSLSRDVKDAIGKIQESMVALMEQADRLRIDTVKQLVSTLTPVQALEYIIAAKKLRLCIQKWGLERDNEQDSKPELNIKV